MNTNLITISEHGRVQIPRNLNLLIVRLIKQKPKSELWSNVDLWFHLNVASKNVGDLFADVQSQTNPFSVHALSLFKKTKYLEKSFYIFLRNTYPWVLNRDYYASMFFVIFFKLTRYIHLTTSLRKLQAIRLQIN